MSCGLVTGGCKHKSPKAEKASEVVAGAQMTVGVVTIWRSLLLCIAFLLRNRIAPSYKTPCRNCCRNPTRVPSNPNRPPERNLNPIPKPFWRGNPGFEGRLAACCSFGVTGPEDRKVQFGDRGLRFREEGFWFKGDRGLGFRMGSRVYGVGRRSHAYQVHKSRAV